jgi:hypothetical protein
MSHPDLSLSKRKLFFQSLDRSTTQASLRTYLSDYRIESCTVPRNDKGENKNHGIVTFVSEETIDELMVRRPHTIDGRQVIIHRSVPNQGPLRNNFMIRNLIVAGMNKETLAQPDIERHFRRYGEIQDTRLMNNEWIIYFDE